MTPVRQHTDINILFYVLGSAEIFSAEEMKLQPLEDFHLLSERKSDVDSAILTLILNMVLLVLAIVILKNVYRVLFKEPLNGPQKLDEQ